MQKYFINSLIFLSTLSPCAYSSYGFYVGASGTATYWDFDVVNDVSATFDESLGLSPAADSTDALSHDDMFYSVEGRFGLYMFAGSAEHWLIAIEGFAGPEDADFAKTTTAISYTANGQDDTVNVAQDIQTRYTYGGQLKLGYFFANRWLGYLLGGALNTFYQLDTAVESGPGGGGTPAVTIASDVIHTGGFRFGGGIEKFWDNQLSLTLQTTYTLYEELDLFYAHSLGGLNLNNVTSATDAVDFDPSAFQVSLGLNYYFGF